MIEIITKVSAARDEEGEPVYKFNKEAFLNALNRFTCQFEVYQKEARIDKRTIEIRVEVEGQAERFSMGDLIEVKAKIKKVKPD